MWQLPSTVFSSKWKEIVSEKQQQHLPGVFFSKFPCIKTAVLWLQQVALLAPTAFSQIKGEAHFFKKIFVFFEWEHFGGLSLFCHFLRDDLCSRARVRLLLGLEWGLGLGLLLGWWENALCVCLVGFFFREHIWYKNKWITRLCSCERDQTRAKQQSSQIIIT